VLRVARAAALCCAIAAGGCSDDPGRPPPPPELDSGPQGDSGPQPDAGEPDASADAGAVETDTVRRDYGTDVPVCPGQQIPLWGDLRWEATIPEGSSLRFSAQAAPAGEPLSSAERVTLGTAPPATPPLYVADELPEDHRNDPQLRITIVMSWPTGGTPPALETLNLDWVCLDRE
jgi:hypothetical protein